MKQTANRLLSVALPGCEESAKAAIYDVAGRQAIAASVPAGSDTFDIDCSALQAGVYILSVQGYEAVRIIVK